MQTNQQTNAENPLRGLGVFEVHVCYRILQAFDSKSSSVQSWWFLLRGQAGSTNDTQFLFRLPQRYLRKRTPTVIC